VIHAISRHGRNLSDIIVCNVDVVKPLVNLFPMIISVLVGDRRRRMRDPRGSRQQIFNEFLSTIFECDPPVIVNGLLDVLFVDNQVRWKQVEDRTTEELYYVQ